jgi:hypothetical protein
VPRFIADGRGHFYTQGRVINSEGLSR